MGLANAGPVQVELVQPLSGETIYEQTAKPRGYGLHHLGIRTDNIEQSVKEIEARAFKVIQSGNRPGVQWVYLDTEEKTGVIFELIEKSEP